MTCYFQKKAIKRSHGSDGKIIRVNWPKGGDKESSNGIFLRNNFFTLKYSKI